MPGFAFQPDTGKALGGTVPSPSPGAAGHLGRRLEPSYLALRCSPAVVFSLQCLAASLALAACLVGAGCLLAPREELLLAAVGR